MREFNRWQVNTTSSWFWWQDSFLLPPPLSNHFCLWLSTLFHLFNEWQVFLLFNIYEFHFTVSSTQQQQQFSNYEIRCVFITNHGKYLNDTFSFVFIGFILKFSLKSFIIWFLYINLTICVCVRRSGVLRHWSNAIRQKG